jgi:hypothetical protein
LPLFGFWSLVRISLFISFLFPFLIDYQMCVLSMHSSRGRLRTCVAGMVRPCVVRGPMDGRFLVWWVIDNFVWTVLTPKIGIGERLICGPNLVTNPVQRGGRFLQKIRQRCLRSAFCFRSAKGLFALISWDRIVTWPEQKEGTNG